MKKMLIGVVVLLSFFCSAMALYGQTDMGQTDTGQTDTAYRYGKETEGPGGEAVIVDIVIARPLGFVALVIGTGAAVVATPFALASGTTHEVYGTLVGQPFYFTVNRPLGEGW